MRVLVALVLAALVAACGGTGPPTPSATSALTPSPGGTASGATGSPGGTASATSGGTTEATAAPPPLAATGRAGLDWTRLTAPDAWEQVRLQHVAAGPGGVLVVGSRRDTARDAMSVWWSPDAVFWTDVSPEGPGTEAIASGVIASGDGFIVFGSIVVAGAEAETAVLWSSANGRDWEQRTVPFPTSPVAAARLGERVVVVAKTMPVGGAPTGSTWTADLATWTPVPLGGGAWPYASGGVVTPDGRLLAFGRVSEEPVDTAPIPQGVVALWTTRDGLTWEPTTPAAFRQGDLTALGARPGRLVAFGRDYPAGMDPEAVSSSAFWWSEDGSFWTRATGPPDLGGTDEDPPLIALDERCILLGSAGAPLPTEVLAASDDGTDWRRPGSQIVIDGRIHDWVNLGPDLLAVGATLAGGDEAGAALWASPTVDR